MDTHSVAEIIAGCFALMAILLSFCQIRSHGQLNTSRGRGHVIRIIGMVPVYCIEAWVGLVYPGASMYLDAFRDMYEAVVLYSFYKLCVDVLLDGSANLKHIFRNMTPVNHNIPFCCLPTWHGTTFYRQTKLGILQWVPVKVVTALISFILNWAGVYDEGRFGWDNGYTYICIITNISQTWALYCLVMFYLGTKKHLKAFKPIPKFLCIKFVVFFTFWQSVLLSLLIKLGVIQDDIHFSAKNFSAALQDFAICIEMFIVSFAHLYAFSVEEFKDFGETGVQGQNMLSSLIDVVDVRDVYQDSHKQFLDTALYGVRNIYGKMPFTTKERRPSEGTELMETTPSLSDAKNYNSLANRKESDLGDEKSEPRSYHGDL